MPKGWIIAGIVAGTAVGVAAGVGGYTFIYARGASYLTNDPAACANCYVMRDQFDGWAKSSHHAVAVCNDCHTPHDLVGKYMTKGLNGYHFVESENSVGFHAGQEAARILGEAIDYCRKGQVSLRQLQK